jgi:hypothetical protein
MAKYKGWTNYETYILNKEIVDSKFKVPKSYNDDILECWNGKKWDKIEQQYVNENYGKELFDYYYDLADTSIKNQLFRDIVQGYLTIVDFEDIAKTLIDDYKKTLI